MYQYILLYFCLHTKICDRLNFFFKWGQVKQVMKSREIPEFLHKTSITPSFPTLHCSKPGANTRGFKAQSWGPTNHRAQSKTHYRGYLEMTVSLPWMFLKEEIKVHEGIKSKSLHLQGSPKPNLNHSSLYPCLPSTLISYFPVTH